MDGRGRGLAFMSIRYDIFLFCFFARAYIPITTISDGRVHTYIILSFFERDRGKGGINGTRGMEG